MIPQVVPQASTGMTSLTVMHPAGVSPQEILDAPAGVSPREILAATGVIP